MAIAETKEKNFEADIEAFFISPAGGYTKGNAAYDPACGLFKDTFIAFIKVLMLYRSKRWVFINVSVLLGFIPYVVFDIAWESEKIPKDSVVNIFL